MIIDRKGALGDMLMMTPAIRELRMCKPDVYIGVRTYFPDVFKNNPYVDEASQYLTKAGEGLLNLNGYYEEDMSRHPVNAYADAIIGVSGFDAKHLELFPDEADRASVDDWWDKQKIGTDPTVVVHLGTTWVQMSSEVLDDTIESLSRMFRVILVGRRQPGKEHYPQKKLDFIDLVGHEWSIHQLHWLIQKSNLFVGTDTGVMHIAATTNTPIVACYSFVDPRNRRPFRDGVAFEGVSATSECEDSHCAEEKKKLTLTGDFCGVDCHSKFKCSMRITSSMIMDKVISITQPRWRTV